MHYHLVLTDERGAYVDVRTVESASEADRLARLALGTAASWWPNRYPGRSWRQGEIAVYLDRKHATHRELSILRCLADGAFDLRCALRTLGIPTLNLTVAPPDDTLGEMSAEQAPAEAGRPEPPSSPPASALPPEQPPPARLGSGRG